MSQFKQSFAWWSFSKGITDPQSFLKSARKIGYEGVELLPREHWDKALEAGLVIASEGAGSLSEGLNRREHHARIEEEVRRKLDLADRYKIQNLIVFSGDRKGLGDEEGLQTTIEGLRRLAPAAESGGVTLVLELLNSKIDHPDYQCDHTQWALKAVEAVASPRVKILFDIYHVQIMEGDIIRTMGQISSQIGHVHTAGNPGRQDLDQDQELNYPALMRTLVKVGYAGFVGQEFIPKGEALEALRKAYQICSVD